MVVGQMYDLIEEWFDRYEMAEYDKFIYLWISFNSWLSKESGKQKDRVMVNWFKNRDDYKQSFVRTTKADERIATAATFFITRKVTNMKTMAKYNMESINDFENAVEVIYQVRCNLFHGDKRRDHWVDREIVQNAVILLECIYRPIINTRRKLRKNN